LQPVISCRITDNTTMCCIRIIVELYHYVSLNLYRASGHGTCALGIRQAAINYVVHQAVHDPPNADSWDGKTWSWGKRNGGQGGAVGWDLQEQVIHTTSSITMLKTW